MTGSISDTDNFVRSRMLFSELNNPNTTNVMSACDHAKVADFKLQNILNLTGRNIDSHRIVNLDQGIWVPNSAGIMSGNIRNALLSHLLSLDLAEFVSTFRLGDEMEDETALGVEQKTEGLVGALDSDDIHESGREGLVSANLSVDLDQTLHNDRVRFTTGQRIFEAVSKDKVEWEGLAQFVWAG